MVHQDFIIYENTQNREGEMALYDNVKKEIVIKGDCYHDHIKDKIEGFFLALEQLEINHSYSPTALSDPEDSIFKMLNFYCEED